MKKDSKRMKETLGDGITVYLTSFLRKSQKIGKNENQISPSILYDYVIISLR